MVLLVLFHAGVIERADQSGAEAVQSLADAIVICFTAISFEAATLDSKLYKVFCCLLSLSMRLAQIWILFS